MKKPFKIGATYKLKDDCISLFQFTNLSSEQCLKYYNTPNYAFTMRVVHMVGDRGGCKCVLVETDGTDIPFCVTHHERRLFTRIDNK